MDFDLIAFFEFKCFDHGGGEPDGETVSPFGNLRSNLLGYTIIDMYIQTRRHVNDGLILVTGRGSEQAVHIMGEISLSSVAGWWIGTAHKHQNAPIANAKRKSAFVRSQPDERELNMSASIGRPPGDPDSYR